jgi:hypothetical protein
LYSRRSFLLISLAFENPLSITLSLYPRLFKVPHKTVGIGGCHFDGNHCLQINVTAMGAKMAPSYANSFMGDLEERLLLSSLKQPLSWFRFIDDVDMKWTHGDKEIDEFLEHANSIHPSIKFTPLSRRPT